LKIRNIILIFLIFSYNASAEYLVVSVKPLELIFNEILPRNFKMSTIYSADSIPSEQELEPHLYTEYATADILFYTSDINEPQVLDIPARKKINVSELIPEDLQLKYEYEGKEYINEYFWFNPEISAIVVEKIIEILATEFPEDAGFFRASANRFKNKSDLMVEKIKINIKRLQLKPFVTDYNYMAYMSSYLREFKPTEMMQKFGENYEIVKLSDVRFAGMLIAEQADKEHYKKLAINFKLKYLYFDVYGMQAKKYTSLIRNMNVKLLRLLI